MLAHLPRAARRRIIRAGFGARPRLRASRALASSDLDDLEAGSIAVAPGRLGEIGTFRLQAREVFGSDVAGDVVAREAGGVQFPEAGEIGHAGVEEAFEALGD